MGVQHPKVARAADERERRPLRGERLPAVRRATLLGAEAAAAAGREVARLAGAEARAARVSLRTPELLGRASAGASAGAGAGLAVAAGPVLLLVLGAVSHREGAAWSVEAGVGAGPAIALGAGATLAGRVHRATLLAVADVTGVATGGAAGARERAPAHSPLATAGAAA